MYEHKDDHIELSILFENNIKFDIILVARTVYKDDIKQLIRKEKLEKLNGGR